MDNLEADVLSDMLLDATDQIVTATKLLNRTIDNYNAVCKEQVAVCQELVEVMQRSVAVLCDMHSDERLRRGPGHGIYDVDPDVPTYFGDRYPLDEADLGGSSSGDQ